MPRGHVDQSNAARGELGNRDSLVINSGHANLRGQSPKHQDSARISWTLDAYPISRIQQKPCSNVQRFLHSRDDGYLPRHTLHASRATQVVSDSASKWTISERVASHQVACRDSAQATSVDLCPQRDGEKIQRRQVRAESPDWPIFVAWEQYCSFAIVRGGWLLPPRRCSFCRTFRYDLEQSFRQHSVDISARPHGPIDITFGLELLKSIDDRSPCQPVLAC